MWNHWVARSTYPYEPFSDFQSSRWAWNLFKRLFPRALGATLMPNHFHLILPKDSEAQDRNRLHGALGAISSRTGIPGLWQSMPSPAQIPDRHHLRRQLRYLALNPCRSSLCSDPLEWYWSTHRDVMGAVVNPWVNAPRLAQELGESKIEFPLRYHAYVSRDPSVAVQGTTAPRPSPSRLLAEEGIGEILIASAAALRSSTSDVQRTGNCRKLFVHMACRQGWRQPSLLSKICKVTPRAIQLILKQCPPQGMVEAALCLGDQRLRVPSQKEKKTGEGFRGSPIRNSLFAKNWPGREEI